MEEAERSIRQAWEAGTRTLGAEHPQTLSSTLALARLLNDKGEPQQAIALLHPVETHLRAAFTGSNSYRLAQSLIQVGRAHSTLGECTEAEPRLLEAQRQLLETPSRDPLDYRRCLLALVQLYHDRNAVEPGKDWDAKARQWQTALDTFDADRRPQP